MFNFVRSLAQGRYLLPLLAVVLLCGCGPVLASPASASTPIPTPIPTSTAAPTPAPTLTPTPDTQKIFASYVGKWEVHDSILTINADQTGLEQWNEGPCADAMCNGDAKITFTENTDGSIKGTIQSVTYSKWDGSPAPNGFQGDPADPQAGDTFQLQDTMAHLLYTTWLGNASSSLNSGNRYWCDSYALKAGWQQCGA
jgi:hypothetical protein